jgi:hypothetical protein
MTAIELTEFGSIFTVRRKQSGLRFEERASISKGQLIENEHLDSDN